MTGLRRLAALFAVVWIAATEVAIGTNRPGAAAALLFLGAVGMAAAGAFAVWWRPTRGRAADPTLLWHAATRRALRGTLDDRADREAARGQHAATLRAIYEATHPDRTVDGPAPSRWERWVRR